MTNNAVVKRPLDAPGCFAQPSVFSHDSNICTRCPKFRGCSKDVGIKLHFLSATTDVTDYLTRHKNGVAKHGLDEDVTINQDNIGNRKTVVKKEKQELTDAQKRFVDSLPKKVGKEAQILLSLNLLNIISKSLLNKTNPFPKEGKKYLHLACELLLSGGFTKKSLKDAYITNYGWSEGTAFSQVSILVSLFLAINVIKETNGNFEINEEEACLI